MFTSKIHGTDRDEVRRRSLLVFLPSPSPNQEDEAFRRRIQSLLGPECISVESVQVPDEMVHSASDDSLAYSRYFLKTKNG